MQKRRADERPSSTLDFASGARRPAGEMLIGDDDDVDLETEHDQALLASTSLADAAYTSSVEQDEAFRKQQAAEAAAREEIVELTPEGCTMLPLMKQLLVAFKSGGVPAAAAQMRLLDIRFANIKAALEAALPRDDELEDEEMEEM